MANGKKWTEDELAYLEYFVYENDAPLREAEFFLNRSQKSISSKLWEMRKMGRRVTKMKKTWTKKEDELIKNHYLVVPVENLSALLGRTEIAIKRRASRLGVLKRRPVSKYDKEIKLMLSSGCYLVDISKELGIQVSSIMTYIKAQGINYTPMPIEERRRRGNGFYRLNKIHYDGKVAENVNSKNSK